MKHKLIYLKDAMASKNDNPKDVFGVRKNEVIK
jgi:hypothetical protein